MLRLLCLLIFLPLLAHADVESLAISPIDKQLIHRTHYSLSYNEEHEVANWVSYILERRHLENCVKRYNSFRSDPLVESGSAHILDYLDSGYDRGHLLPAGDMKYSREAMKETFFLSNITPQPASFNRGKWNHLETLTRAWTLKHNKVWVVTGPILDDYLPTIGVLNEVSVPLEYFKVILRMEEDGYRGIAFLIPTDTPFPELISYAVSIDTVEDLSGIDFFSFLPDLEEEEIESEMDTEEWDFKAPFEYLPCSASAVQ